MKMEQTECSETSAYKNQMPGNYPEDNIQHSEHGESLKSKILVYAHFILHISCNTKLYFTLGFQCLFCYNIFCNCSIIWHNFYVLLLISCTNLHILMIPSSCWHCNELDHILKQAKKHKHAHDRCRIVLATY
jgi:hypothetical protein